MTRPVAGLCDESFCILLSHSHDCPHTSMIVRGSPFCSSVSPTIDNVSLEKQSMRAFTCLVVRSSDNPDRLQYESHWVLCQLVDRPVGKCTSVVGLSSLK